MERKTLRVSAIERGRRLDIFLAAKLPEHSRAYFQKLINSGRVLVDSQKVKPDYLIKSGNLVSVKLEKISTDIELKPEKIDLDIIYEDDRVAVINKQPGLVVHPGSGNLRGTLVNALLARFPQITSTVKNADKIARERPGIVHRLDKDTSGAMIIAKTSQAMRSLARQLQNRTAHKTYWAICSGWPKKDGGILINFLGRHPKNRKVMTELGPEKGREAVSEYEVLSYYAGKQFRASLIEFKLKTGRTHQIRVQSSLSGFPILGDAIYGTKISRKISSTFNIERQMLHAKTLRIYLPGDNKISVFDAPLPADFSIVLKRLDDLKIND